MVMRRTLSLIWCVLLFPVVYKALQGHQANESELMLYSQQAEQAMAAKDWARALGALERLSQLAPTVPEVQGNLGMAYYSQGRPLEASRAFQRALKLNPRMAQAKVLLGLCEAELGHNKEAIAILEPAFRHPADKNTARLVGLDLQKAYAGLGQYAKAVAVSDELLRRYPNDAEILFHDSRLSADRAYQTMTQLIQADPNSVWVHYANAEVHESMQRFDLALAEYKKVVEMEPRLPEVHFRIGRVLLQSSKDSRAADEALGEFRQALTIEPENSNAEYEIGEVNRQRGQLEQALAHFSRALQFRPDFLEAQIGLARTLLSLGKYQEARSRLEAAVRLDSQSEVAHFLLASAYKALGDGGNYQKEMTQFQKLRESQSRARPPAPAGLARTEVTRQVLAPEGSATR
jgi:tetratricopeptide (TPR) repeat protein